MAELSGVVNCSDLFNSTVPQLQPNSDIAGIGVILSFLLAAYIPLVFIICCYFTGVVPIQLLSRGDTDFFRVKFRRRSQWHKTLVKAIALFSDTQIVTGISILVAVFSRLSTTSVYHFRIAMFLAWMASNTHLTTLVVLRRYLMKSKVLRAWRIIGMVVLYGMLLVTFVPGLSWNWELLTKGEVFDSSQGKRIFLNINLPAQCLFEGPPTVHMDTELHSQIFSNASRTGWWMNVILVSGLYALKAGLLFPGLSYLIYYVAKAYPLYMLEKALKKSAEAACKFAVVRHNTGGSALSKPAHQQRFARFRYRALVSLYIIIYALMDFLQTFIVNVILLAWGSVWGTLQIVTSSSTFNAQDSQENFWGFGQILPMMLLLLPIASVIDSLFGSKDKEIGQGTHHALIAEEGSSRTSSRLSVNSQSTSRSSSRVPSYHAAHQPIRLTDAHFAHPPRYQQAVSYPEKAHGDHKVPVAEEYDLELLLDSPMESPAPEVVHFPIPPRGTSRSTSPLPPRSTSPLPPRSTSPMPVRGRTTSLRDASRSSVASHRNSMDKLIPQLPAPHQFLGAPRPPDDLQPLSEWFRTNLPQRPHLRNPTAAAFAEEARTLALHRYLYRSKWCQATFAFNTLALVSSIGVLALFGILQSQNPLNVWNSTITVGEIWLGMTFIWWFVGCFINHDLYR